MLSIIIPTYQAAIPLGRTLTPLQSIGENDHLEIIVSDGGSSDATIRIARAFGVRTIDSSKGRGKQLQAGADAAHEEWMLFLHADTQLESNWWQEVHKFITNKGNLYHAAYFLFSLDDSNPQARRIEKAVDWRCQMLGLPYGDQGLLISRAFYDYLGGFHDFPLMEDVDFIRRIGSHRLHCLPVNATTSADRYRRDGYIKRPFKNLCCLGLYYLGVSPETIVKIYQ